MTKTNNPLFSIKASGSLAKTISFVKRRGQSIVEKKPEIPDAKSLAQLSWRHMYLKAVALWHALSAAEKQEWESLARRRHMTGFAWFMSQCLKPNPGLYLPLQGGTMQGDIDMSSHSILGLPTPAVDAEAANKEYVDAEIASALYAEGCLVYRSANLNVANNTATLVSWDTEEYDTDNIHSVVASTMNLVCRTAGKYVVVFGCSWAANATGWRRISLYQFAAPGELLRKENWGNAAIPSGMTFARLANLAVDDYLVMQVKQNSGGVLAFRGTRLWSFFGMQRVG